MGISCLALASAINLGATVYSRLTSRKSCEKQSLHSKNTSDLGRRPGSAGVTVREETLCPSLAPRLCQHPTDCERKGELATSCNPPFSPQWTKGMLGLLPPSLAPRSPGTACLRCPHSLYPLFCSLCSLERRNRACSHPVGFIPPSLQFLPAKLRNILFMFPPPPRYLLVLSKVCSLGSLILPHSLLLRKGKGGKKRRFTCFAFLNSLRSFLCLHPL